MKHTFLSPKKKQFKANFHCHSTLSDGKLTPEELKKLYRENGYSILAITDHERPHDHSALSQEDFLMFTGYEVYIRPERKYDIFRGEIHMNLLSTTPHNTKFICCDPGYCRYITPEELEKLEKVESDGLREYTVEYVNRLVRIANENGYLVTYNHPVWSMEDHERILSYEGFFSLEIDNYSSYCEQALEHDGDLYDKSLRLGYRWACHGSDDNHNKFPPGHPKFDSLGAFTFVQADRLNYESVAEALKNKEFYSSTGPQIFEISIENDTVFVSCSEARGIILHDGSKSPRSEWSADNTLTSAQFSIRPEAKYVRVSVLDGNGKRASSRGIFRDEWEDDCTE